MEKLKPCPFCGKPVWICYSSGDKTFGVRHETRKDTQMCRVIEPIILDAISLADAAKAWNWRMDDETD